MNLTLRTSAFAVCPRISQTMLVSVFCCHSIFVKLGIEMGITDVNIHFLKS